MEWRRTQQAQDDWVFCVGHMQCIVREMARDLGDPRQLIKDSHNILISKPHR